MRVVEKSPFISEDGSISLENRLRATIEHGLAWFSEMRAQDYVTDRLANSLDDNHVLVRNAQLPGTDITLPLILIGPQGVRAILASPVRGIFRAKGDTWMVFNQRGQRFRPAKPNLQARVLAVSRALLTYYQNQGIPLPEIEPVLVLSDPRTHVDLVDQETHILLADGIRPFAVGLDKGQPIMDQEDVQNVTGLLTDPPENVLLPQQPTPLPEATPEPEPEPHAAPARGPEADDPFQFERLAAGNKRRTILGMSVAQLALLAVMFVFEIAILGAFAYLVFFNSP
jgi:hypothetical protein